MALPVRMRPGENGHRTAGIEPQAHAVVGDAAALDIAADRAAAPFSPRFRLRAPRGKSLPIAERQA